MPALKALIRAAVELNVSGKKPGKGAAPKPAKKAVFKPVMKAVTKAANHVTANNVTRTVAGPSLARLVRRNRIPFNVASANAWEIRLYEVLLALTLYLQR